MLDLLVSVGVILLLRMIGVTFDTLRILMVVRSRKLLAWGFGFCQTLAYLGTIGFVVSDLGNWTKILGYAIGFATGLVIGMTVENRLAIGYTNLQIVSPNRGLETAERLRDLGYAVTEVSAHGKDGAVEVLYISVLRKYEASIYQIISKLDPDAFIIAKNVYRIQHGLW